MHAVADRELSQSTVAQALYLGAPPVHFARLVAILQAALDRLTPGERARDLNWDCDDVAIFRIGGLRIALAITDAPGTDYAACITVSAGPETPGVQGPLLRRAGGICRLITDRLTNETTPDAVLWHKVQGVVTADTVDTLVWRLAGHDLLAFALPPAPPMAPVRNEVHDLRASIYTPHELSHPVQESTIVRLATHAANATLVAAVPPVGGPVWTLSLIQGENPRLTARVMALTGAGIAMMLAVQNQLPPWL